MIIGEGWIPQDAVPESSLAHECDRCKETSDRVEGLRVKRFDSRGERKAQKIREMQRDAKETPKIADSGASGSPTLPTRTERVVLVTAHRERPSANVGGHLRT